MIGDQSSRKICSWQSVETVQPTCRADRTHKRPASCTLCIHHRSLLVQSSRRNSHPGIYWTTLTRDDCYEITCNKQVKFWIGICGWRISRSKSQGLFAGVSATEDQEHKHQCMLTMIQLIMIGMSWWHRSERQDRALREVDIQSCYFSELTGCMWLTFTELSQPFQANKCRHSVRG